MDRTELKTRIKDMIIQAEESIREMKELTKPISPENSIGRVSRMDAINNKSVMESTLRKKEEKLTKLKMAFSKIDQADFGICTQCKNVIQEGRLIFMPESTLCIRCASR